jgi:hypothetical protein
VAEAVPISGTILSPNACQATYRVQRQFLVHYRAARSVDDCSPLQQIKYVNEIFVVAQSCSLLSGITKPPMLARLLIGSPETVVQYTSAMSSR